MWFLLLDEGITEVSTTALDVSMSQDTEGMAIVDGSLSVSVATGTISGSVATDAIGVSVSTNTIEVS